MKAILRSFVGMGTLAVLILSAKVQSTPATLSRGLSSMAFPVVEQTNNTKSILSEYEAYLQFVLSISRQTDATNASRLAKTYNDLRERSPENAARFLKGLRFELIHKLELMGYPPQKILSSNPEMRRMVTKYTKIWYRECGEYLLRGIVAKIERRQETEAE